MNGIKTISIAIANGELTINVDQIVYLTKTRCKDSEGNEIILVEIEFVKKSIQLPYSLENENDANGLYQTIKAVMNRSDDDAIDDNSEYLIPDSDNAMSNSYNEEEINVPDSTPVNAPFSPEELEDAKALTDINLSYDKVNDSEGVENDNVTSECECEADTVENLDDNNEADQDHVEE